MSKDAGNIFLSPGDENLLLKQYEENLVKLLFEKHTDIWLRILAAGRTMIKLSLQAHGHTHRHVKNTG